MDHYGRYEIDEWGRPRLSMQTQGMMFPVRCLICQGVYDTAKVEVTARYTDCSVWTTPCCNTPGIDDRPPGWGGPRRYEELPRR